MIQLSQVQYYSGKTVTKFLISSVLAHLLSITVVVAQVAQNYKWWNPEKNSFPVVEGRVESTEMQTAYERPPASFAKKIGNAAQQSAGLLIRFKASTNEIAVRYSVTNQSASADLPQTAVSGIDLYAVDADGNFFWCKGTYHFGDTIEYRFQNLKPNDRYHKKGREYRLYLPLFASVTSLEIGVPDTADFTFLPIRPEKPIVVYGGAPVQGEAASRPGLTWTAMLGRKMDRSLINLGFSGNTAFNKELLNQLTGIDAKIYVLDCLSAIHVSSNADAKSNTMQAVTEIRAKRPSTPILLIALSSSNSLILQLNEESGAQYQAVQDAYAALKQEGINDIYLLDNNEQALNQNSFASTGLNDLGMQQYADAVESITRTILKEPTGIASTTQPRTQTRDARIYDWETRHRYVLHSNAVKQPEVVFLGNSITHYWGGLPHGPIESAGDAKNPFFESLHAADLGYGWDRVENVLWRIYHGELDGYQVRQAVLLIGTNNLDVNTDSEILEGIKYVVHGIEIRQPNCKILLLGLLPRRGYEQRVATFNEGLAQLAGILDVSYADAGSLFLKEDGKIEESLFSDGLHPTPEGYRKLESFLYPYLAPANQANGKNETTSKKGNGSRLIKK